MDVIERLTKQEKDLGYEGETLRTFVKEQRLNYVMSEKPCAKLNVKGVKLRLLSMKLKPLCVRLGQKFSVTLRQKLGVKTVRLRQKLSMKSARLRQNLSARN